MVWWNMEELENKIKQSFFNLLERPRTPGSIHVSALPFCLRREFFNIKFNANPQPNSNMVSGKIHHLALRYLDVFDGAEFEVEVSEELKSGYRLSGRVDIVCRGIGVIYEFKFTKRANSQELDPLYFAQANAYAVMCGCEKFYLVKVHRDTLDVRIIEGEADRDAFNVLKQRALQVIDCLENNVIPFGPERDWECKNCVYNIVCKNLKEEQRRLEE